MEIFTIGYGGLNLDQFINYLVDIRIECLVDIRELPISRKRGFAKSALSNRLQGEDIDYQHFRVLGSPRAHRLRVRESKNYSQFFAAMTRHLASTEASEAMNCVIALASEMRTCLMCYCPNWERCHRRSVVEAIGQQKPIRFSHILHGETGASVVHQDDFYSTTQDRRAA